MTLSETLQQKLAEWKPGDGRQVLGVPDQGAGWGASLTTDRTDQLGGLVWELTLRRANPPASNEGSLRAWAERVARKATGLLEPLKVVEVDAPRLVALLRSQEPACRGDDLHYYEVLLHGAAEASVRRYHASREPGTRRQVGFALTHEAIAKLADDLITER